ncbi:hypothetical protein [Spirosoma sp. KNUC1025]
MFDKPTFPKNQALVHKDESPTNIYLDSFGSNAVDAGFDSLR